MAAVRRNRIVRSPSLPIVLLCCSLLMLAACTSEQDTVSANAETVIHAIMDTPNAALFDEAHISHLGVQGNTLSEEEKAKQEAKRAEIRENWENAVGSCFSPGSLEPFLNSYAATAYHGESFVSRTSSAVRSMTLLERTERREIVSVEPTIGDEPRTATVTFYRNPDELFYQVDLVEDPQS